MTAEARLEQLKADIARRKLQRQQEQGTPEAEKVKTDASVFHNKEEYSRRDRQHHKAQKQEKPTSKQVHSDRSDDDFEKNNNRKERLQHRLGTGDVSETRTIENDLSHDELHKDINKEGTKTRRRTKKQKLSALELNNTLNDVDKGRSRQERTKGKGKTNQPGKDSSKAANSPDSSHEEDEDESKSRSGSDLKEHKAESKDNACNGAESNTGKESDPNVIGGFSILGNFTHEPVKPVKRKLPDWLANPTIIGGGLKKRRLESTDKEEVEDEAVMKILDDDLKQNLLANGIRSFFPVQRQFIPEIWKDLRFSIMCGRYGLRPRDFCVSAPTGSGKTLAYTLPIIQCLKQRWEPHVSAVVVLPVRDLAEQVYNVFCQYCQGTSLKIGLVVGKSPFSVEQETLVSKRYPDVYHSLVDILVATPGRLVDHVNSTPGFDLSHLRFLMGGLNSVPPATMGASLGLGGSISCHSRSMSLSDSGGLWDGLVVRPVGCQQVIDEADRMMEDIKHDWLSLVEKAAYTAAPQAYRPLSRVPPGPLTLASAQCSQLPLQKLLFSATLSHNPEKLERLNLFMPRLMTSVVAKTPAAANHVQADTQEHEENKTAEENTENAEGGFVGKYTTPEGLTEYLVESESSEKPLVVLHFLHNLKFRSVLCFTNSVETTHRLCLLVKLFGGLTVKEFSSRLPAERRKKILKQFSKGKIDLLVCSDVMARGMDVDNVKYVISYDNPPFIKTYIHRVGRTARAGRAGTAISLLEKKEFFHFKKMMREAGKWPQIREMKLARQALKPLVEPFQSALSQLPQVIQGEKKKHPKH